MEKEFVFTFEPEGLFDSVYENTMENIVTVDILCDIFNFSDDFNLADYTCRKELNILKDCLIKTLFEDKKSSSEDVVLPLISRLKKVFDFYEVSVELDYEFAINYVDSNLESIKDTAIFIIKK